jgi:hypothetical protein
MSSDLKDRLWTQSFHLFQQRHKFFRYLERIKKAIAVFSRFRQHFPGPVNQRGGHAI